MIKWVDIWSFLFCVDILHICTYFLPKSKPNQDNFFLTFINTQCLHNCECYNTFCFQINKDCIISLYEMSVVLFIHMWKLLVTYQTLFSLVLYTFLFFIVLEFLVTILSLSSYTWIFIYSDLDTNTEFFHAYFLTHVEWMTLGNSEKSLISVFTSPLVTYKVLLRAHEILFKQLHSLYQKVLYFYLHKHNIVYKFIWNCYVYAD